MEKITVKKAKESMVIIKDGKMLAVYEGGVEVLHQLETKIYELDCSKPADLLFLKEVDPFVFPERVYDIEKDFRRQALETFRKRNKNMGILFEGQKGQGKTLTAKKLCEESGLPVIMISNKIPLRKNFVSYINSIKCDLIVLCDEFEKVFDSYASEDDNGFHSQESFLSFMDGTLSNSYKRLFILTTNRPINDKFINRPSRILYYKQYEQMPREVYDMIIEDKLINKEFEEDLRKNLGIFDSTIDLLTSVIEEINIQDSPYSSFKEYFNHKPSIFKYDRFVKSGNDWRYDLEIHESTPVTKDSNCIGGEYGAVVTDINNGYIYYTLGSRSKVKNPDEFKEYRLKEIKSYYNVGEKGNKK